MENETFALLMAGGFLGLLFVGVPVATSLLISGFVFGYLGFGSFLFDLLPARFFGVVTNYTLMAAPLFVFMGVMLEKSRLAEDLLDIAGHMFGRLPGGMGVSVIVVGVLMGASTGIVGATVVTLGLLTLPVFLRRNYNKALSCGIICSSGTLGQIIPPSLVLILLADILSVSVGTIFAAAMIPGLVLSAIYIAFVLCIGAFRPDWAPPIPSKERDAMTKSKLLKEFFRVVVPVIGLILAVLGSIIGGVAAPTEAASMGSLGALLIVAISGRLDKEALIGTLDQTLKITAMIFFILISSQVFSLSFRGLGGDHLVASLFELIPGGVTADLVFMLLLVFVLGFFLEWIEISYIVLPLFVPIFANAGVDMVWLAMLISMTLQTTFLSPPVGWSLFFLKGVAPPEVTTRDIYLGAMPFLILQVIAVVMIFNFPDIALWLPRYLGW
ncbi:sialic acid TRAP transporter permease protein SiaT [Roseovarius sp. A-2]|uniref:TRAP transporter large permease n=1 Tax=Roseovarius sp. A-2 TaxID=1570360 RepID=UPI0009C4E417|nr:TRAP transporter large permease subunit [Roseovarius sp. A-2]GAW35069.1 sialic acid TRAP transporter permease protein SiaT [Roseovarius sp. A-2]